MCPKTFSKSCQMAIVWYDWHNVKEMLYGFLRVFQKCCEKWFMVAIFFFRRNLNSRRHPCLVNYKKPRQRKMNVLLLFVFVFGNTCIWSIVDDVYLSLTDLSFFPIIILNSIYSKVYRGSVENWMSTQTLVLLPWLQLLIPTVIISWQWQLN